MKKQKSGKIFFRADGHAKMGLGHVIRSLALAEMLSEDFDCHFIIRNPLPALKSQILEVCKSIIEIPETDDHDMEAQMLADKYLSGEEIVVLDGYHFQTEYQRIIKNTGCKLVCIDDIHAYHFVADAVINHAPGLISDKYSGESCTKYFLGLKYALLRKPFRTLPNEKNYQNRQENVFICLGGADPYNDTLKVVKRCESAGILNTFYVVIGPAYNFKDELYEYVKSSKLDIELLFNVSAEKIAQCMQRCKYAITSPSTVALEFLSIGGVLFLKTIADNQIHIKKYLMKNELALDFDTNFKTIDKELAKKMYARQDQIFDGRQHLRLNNIFLGLCLQIRRADHSDCLLYFNWANDPLTRTQSFNSTPIPYEEHEKWFFEKLNSTGHVLYIAMLNKIPIGQIRFDLKNGEATINYMIDKYFRGKGFAPFLLKEGIQMFKKEFRENVNFIGYVKEDNIPSRKAFVKLGFVEDNNSEHPNSFKYTFS